jgi:hypothetical protein
VAVRFVDIGGFVDHHCLDFLYIRILVELLRPSLFKLSFYNDIGGIAKTITV